MADPLGQFFFLVLQGNVLREHSFPTKQIHAVVSAAGIEDLQGRPGGLQAVQRRRGILFHQSPELLLCGHQRVNFGLIPFQGKGEEPAAKDQHGQIPPLTAGDGQVMDTLDIILLRKLYVFELPEIEGGGGFALQAGVLPYHSAVDVRVGEEVAGIVQQSIGAAHPLSGCLLPALGHILLQLPPLAHGLVIFLLRETARLVRPNGVRSGVAAQAHDPGGVAPANSLAPLCQPRLAAHRAGADTGEVFLHNEHGPFHFDSIDRQCLRYSRHEISPRGLPWSFIVIVYS